MKILVPDMPTADELLPYLRRMDARKVYVNGGPLLDEVEARLAAMIGMSRSNIVCVANGTQAIELALRALNIGGRGRNRVLVPAMTFVATGRAIMNAGLFPALCDVDRDTWTMTPEIARKNVALPLRSPWAMKLGAVVPVCTYGVPQPVSAWEAFSEDTGIPVLIDAAGAFPWQSFSDRLTFALSFHATKFLGAGEGGAVIGSETIVSQVRAMANFGDGGTNAKMSEYHAAVLMASLDRSNPKVNRLRELLSIYGKHWPTGWRAQKGAAFGSPALWNARIHGGAGEATARMEAAGIETRRWYAPWLDERPEFAPFVNPLEVTNTLRSEVIGLPLHTSMTDDSVRHVCEVASGNAH